MRERKEYLNKEIPFIEVMPTETSRLSPFETKIVLIKPHLEEGAIHPHEHHNLQNLEEVRNSLYTRNWKGKPIAAFGIDANLYDSLPVGVSFLPNLPDNKLIVADGTHRLEAARRLNRWAIDMDLPYLPFPVIPVQILSVNRNFIQIGSWNERRPHSIEEIIDLVNKGELMLPKETKFMVKYPSSDYDLPEENFINDDKPIVVNQVPLGSLLRVRTIQPDVSISRDQMYDLAICLKLISKMLGPRYNKPFKIADIPT